MTWRVIVHKDPLRFDTTDLLIIEHGAVSGEHRMMKPVEFETMQRHGAAEPTLRIEDERMDELLQAFATKSNRGGVADWQFGRNVQRTVIWAINAQQTGSS